VADGPGSHLFGLGVGADGGLGFITGFPPTGTAAGPTALVPGRDASRLYATFSGANSVGTYVVSADGNVGTPVSTPAGLAPSAAAVSPSGAQLFVTNAGASTISRYSIDPSSGDPVLQTGATSTGSAPGGLALSPDGAHLYTANTGADTISIFTVSGASLTATFPDDPDVPAGDGPTGLAVTPDGAHLYATNSGDGTISGWTIGSDGSLTSIGDPVAAGSGARGIAVSPDGKLLLAANPGDSSISRFTIAAAGGTLTPAFGGAAAGPAGARSVVFSPSSTHAYVAGSTAVAAYDVSPFATLAPHGSPVVTTTEGSALAITPDQGPQASFNSIPDGVGKASKFQGGASPDGDGTVASWIWDFGDGTTGAGAIVDHVFQAEGTYTVRLTVTDDEGCSGQLTFTGQAVACNGSPFASSSQSVRAVVLPPDVTPPQTCAHDGDDGYCGTPDHKAPQTAVLGFNDGESITTLDAPTELVGAVTPDPSGIKSVRLRFTKAAGKVRKKRTSYKRVCRKVKGKRKCHRKKVVKRSKTKVPACLTISGTKSYLVKYVCTKVKWITVPGAETFRYDLPLALGLGSYTVDAVAVDGAGNADVLEKGRNHMTFKVIKTPSNAGGDGGVPTTTTPTTTTPVPTTGSPFGR
jgi:DNA-binding beta-propeller fold protein YncE